MKKELLLSLAILIGGVSLVGCGQMGGDEAIGIETTSVKPAPVRPARAATPAREELMVADFDSGEKPSNIGGDFGAWDKDPTDFSQGCSESFDSTICYGQKGFAMRLDYDVDSRNPAYNGFWMFLQGLDGSKYNNVAFRVKGDAKKGYTTAFKMELKNAKKQVGRYYVNNVSDKWQKIIIPLKAFKGMTDFSGLKELVIVFEDRIASSKKGTIYIDEISFN